MVLVVASDVVSLTHCARRLWYEYNPPSGAETVVLDPFDQLMIELGHEHEQRIRDQLSAENEVVEAISLEHTQELMEAGVDVIYQGQLLDKKNQLFGQPDFLIRSNTGSYQAADAKSAHSVKPEIGVQVAFYRRLLGGGSPGLVYLGNGAREEVEAEFDAKLNTYITEARQVLEHDRPLVRYSESKCTACPYYEICQPEFVEAQDLTLLYGVQARSVPGLEAQGFDTIARLAEADPQAITDVPYLKGDKKERAVLQARAWLTDEMFKLSNIELPGGTWVHFDIEANPLTSDGHQHVYLWGFLTPPYREDSFEFVWTDCEDEDEAGWNAFLAKVEAYRSQWPDLQLIHFANYERDQISAYAKRFNMEGHGTVTWLLDKEGGPLYDIKKSVAQSLVLPLSRYGLKDICKHPGLVNFQWTLEESGSQWSVVQYIEFLRSAVVERRQRLKEDILTYNRDDVRATRALELWLRSL